MNIAKRFRHNTNKSIILGNFNARIGNAIIVGGTHWFHEEQINNHGEFMVKLFSLRYLRINNSFYNHKQVYKIIEIKRP